jgi:PhnB protein
MTYISPYLTFNGNCREAMTFYRDCLGGDLTLQTVGESPMSDQWPSQVQHLILHAGLVRKKLTLLASDMGGPTPVVGNVISLALACSNAREIRVYFDNLSAGGKVTHHLHRFYNGTIGALTDKYGMNWVLKL